MADVTPEIGDVFAGKYRVERRLGAGGMGVVLEATHLQLGQRVALKVMTSELRDNESVLKRFEREARAAARLEGEHVARVYDFGEVDDGSPYIVMEFLEGEDLCDRIDREGRQAVARAVDLILQACVGTAEAHAAGIVHRDIKPANLFLAKRKDGRTILKVLDFGISKLVDGGQDTRLTTGEGTIGSPMYMSPEQIESVRTVDHRTDIWALGAVLYELLTGYPPFVADSAAKVYVKVLSDDPEPLCASGADLPSGLQDVLNRALAKSLDSRYPTVADFAHALAPFGSGRAPALAAAAAGIIASSPLAHDELPPVPLTVPPPTGPEPDVASAEEEQEEPVPPTVEEEELVGAETLPAESVGEEDEVSSESSEGPEGEASDVPGEAIGVVPSQKTSGAASWVREEPAGRPRRSLFVMAVVAVVGALVFVGVGKREDGVEQTSRASAQPAPAPEPARKPADRPTNPPEATTSESSPSGDRTESAAGARDSKEVAGDTATPEGETKRSPPAPSAPTRPKARNKDSVRRRSPSEAKRASSPKEPTPSKSASPAPSSEPAPEPAPSDAIFRYRE